MITNNNILNVHLDSYITVTITIIIIIYYYYLKKTTTVILYYIHVFTPIIFPCTD